MKHDDHAYVMPDVTDRGEGWWYRQVITRHATSTLPVGSSGPVA